MKAFDLAGVWRIRSGCGTYDIEGNMPGTLFQALEESGYWGEKDLFWRENNRKCPEIADRDFMFSRRFTLPDDFLTDSDRISLDAEGLDTLTEIRINGTVIGRTENMHRRYYLDATGVLKQGENSIEITFFNSLAYIREKQEKRYIWSAPDNIIDGFNRIRKCSSSFGWDWGPQVPDLGIWRSLSLKAVRRARLGDTRISQEHLKDNGGTDRVILSCSSTAEGNTEGTSIRYTLTSPSGKTWQMESAPGKQADIVIGNPELWWPNGYGGQPLYTLKSELFHKGQLLDRGELKTGLRTVELDRTPDEWGESFGFRVNGITLFAMGGNIIPRDVCNARAGRKTAEELLGNCRDANFNCIRVWGGGIYPDRDFYEICDRFGLLVWQDLMFACALYEADCPEFREELRLEITDNLSRISHHPSLALICGNNEMEWAFEEWEQMRWDGRNKAEYTLQYEYFLPELSKKVTPLTPYWKASPSSGGFFDNPNDPDRGDVHYWDVWHGGAPFTDLRKHHFRFLSEYGFQSFPSYKTVCSYTEEGDRNPYSPVMEDHQRNGDYAGNRKIMKYAADYFRLGKDMDANCYLSQLSQAEAGRYAVEHLRQNRGRCLGSTYWQVNDNWPVASWSSIDYYGRWKALHYAMKRAYAPVLLSCREEGAMAEIYVSTEGMDGFKGTLKWALKECSGRIIRRGEESVQVAPPDIPQIGSGRFQQRAGR